MNTYDLRFFYSISLISCLLLWTLNERLSAQTMLELGDIAFTGYNADNPPNGADGFSFVLLKEVTAGTEITFTEQGWLAAGGFGTSEGTIVLTFGNDYPCGAQFRLEDQNPPQGNAFAAFDQTGAAAGAITQADVFTLSSAGDQIFAYQGAEPTGADLSNFIAAIQMNGPWDDDATSGNNSAQPAIFTDGMTSLSFETETDNALYDCFGINSGDPETLRTAINNPDNWLTDDDTGFNLSGFCGFSCSTDCDEPDVPVLTLSEGPYCPGDTVSVSIAGNLNDATQWILYADSCGGPVIASTTDTLLSLIPSSSVTYLVGGAGGCVTEVMCASFSVPLTGQTADAGPDQLVTGSTSTTLEGNDPAPDTGLWTFVDNGDGMGVIDDPTAFNSAFNGTAGQGYILQWTIDNDVCGTSSDNVCIAFADETPLELGDIAFTAYNSDTPDGFSFVLLTDVNAGTTINFTERGWFASNGGFRAGEGTLTLSLGKPYICGSEIRLTDLNSPDGNAWAAFDADGNSAGPLVPSGGTFTLSTDGDQILAYQGDEPTLADQSGFLAAIQMNGPWNADAEDSNTSAQPPIFADNPGNDIALDTIVDNARYTCTITGADPESLRATVNNPGNWEVDDENPFDLAGSFCGLACCIPPEVTAVNGEGEYCPGEEVTLSIDGMLNDAEDWVWYTGNCGEMPVPGGMGDSITVVVTETITYFVRGEGGCADAFEPCLSVTLTLDTTAVVLDCSMIDPNRANDPGECSFTMPGAGFDPVADDNCPGVALTNDFNDSTSLAGETFPVGTTPVTWIATDAAGNMDTCVVDIVITDEEAPVVQCQDATFTFAGQDAIAIPPDLVLDTAGTSDNCGFQVDGISPDSVSCEDIGSMIEVTITVSDDAGNTASCTATVAVEGLPCGWIADGDGIGCEDGNEVMFDPGTDTWTLTAINCFIDINEEEDESSFVAQEWCGDGEITAQVTSITGTGWAGVNIRENEDPGSKKAELTINDNTIGNTNLVRYAYRQETGGAEIVGYRPKPSVNWLRLRREGNTFTGFSSHNGLNWAMIFQDTIDMPDCLLYGLLDFSYDSSDTISANFDNVVIGPVTDPLIGDQPEGLLQTQGEAAPEIGLHPNPATQEIFLDLRSLSGTQAEIELYNQLGLRVYRDKVAIGRDPVERVDLTGLDNGFYIVVVRTEEDGVSAKRLVLKR